MNNSIKKGVVVAVILLFISVSVIPSTGTTVEKTYTVSFDGNTLYVGGNGTGNYSTIQEAIDNASDGDTVFVYDDSSPYYENIIVNKQISLIGEDKDTTNIIGIGAEDIIFVNANNVLITDFTIKADVWDEAGVNVKSGGCTVENNKIDSCLYGVYLTPGDSAIIKNNKITGNQRGIVMEGTKLSMISNNIIRSTDSYCIQMSGTGLGNTIMRNNLTNSFVGIQLIGSKQSIVKENNFANNIAHIGENRYSFFVKYKNNYWGGNTNPQVIDGAFTIPFFVPGGGIRTINIPYFRIDWHPALKPYDIGV